MKIECTKEKLFGAVSKAEKISGKHLTLPVLSCILLEAKKNALYVRATNLDVGVEISFPVKVDEEGIVAVSGSVLSGFLSNLYTDKNIKLETIKGNLSLTGGKTSITIKSLPHEDFPTIPKIQDGTVFHLESTDLLKGLTSVWYASGTSSMKPELSSVYMYAEDDSLVFVATDSFRLAEKRIKTKKPKDFSHVLIPFKNVLEIVRIFEEVKGEITVEANKNQISFSAEGIYLTSRVVDGVFPDYKQIIPKKFGTEVILLKQDLVNTLKISNIFSDSFRQVHMKADPKKEVFEVQTKNADVGESISSPEAALTGEPIEINFNFKYIMDCFQSIDADSVSLEFSALNRPMVMRGVADRSFTYLVMPMNK
ncbi:MAG: DNA polymerase III subunit beta [Candidatus Pacebacteria bacterium]|nr:DNA polymerase III subunit beta [Candidatus Paceibacterota bacterium]